MHRYKQGNLNIASSNLNSTPKTLQNEDNDNDNESDNESGSFNGGAFLDRDEGPILSEIAGAIDYVMRTNIKSKNVTKNTSFHGL